MKLYLIIIPILFLSCSKNKQKEIKFSKNIDIKIENAKKSEKIEFNYNFKNNIIFKVESFQFIKTKINSFVINISFNINLNDKGVDKNYHKFGIYIDNFKIKNKNLLAHYNLEDMFISYRQLLTASYFDIKINEFGDKKIIVEKKIDNNPNLRKINYFLLNIIEHIFVNLKENNISINLLDSEDKIKKQKIEYEKKYFYNNNKILIKYSSKDKLKKSYFLYSKKLELPIKINYKNNASYEIKLDGKIFNYKLNNYYFIEKL